MHRLIAWSTLCILWALAVAPSAAQDQPGQGRGRGFRGGRGPGMAADRGMRNHQEAAAHDNTPNHLNFPVISSEGGVVHLPDAAQQPQEGTKLLVDLTSGGSADQLNTGLQKVAKYLNIFAGAGAKPVKVQISVVVHGDATLIVLNKDAYSSKFTAADNPNLKLIEELHANGVKFYVCGQSLISKGSDPKDVAPFVQTAVSALTAVVNLQADGYAYVPVSGSPQPTAAKLAKDLESTDHDEHEHVGGAAMGLGMGRGPGAMRGMQEDMATLHALFDGRSKVTRKVTNLPDGAEAVTESDDAAIADLIKEHVPAMEDRVVGNKPLPPMTFHPVFVELIKHADDYTLTYEETEKGIKVRYHAADPYVIMLVQEHAKLVSRFIKNGMEEVHAPYTFPNASEPPRPAER